jgi:hypothetical protein
LAEAWRQSLQPCNAYPVYRSLNLGERLSICA